MTNEQHDLDQALKHGDILRQDATETIRRVSKMLTRAGIEEMKADYADRSVGSVMNFQSQKIQTSSDPDKKIVQLVDGMDKYVAYTKRSLEWQLKDATKTIEYLDRVDEAIQQLDPKFRILIKTLYRTPGMKYETAATTLGYRDASGMTRAKNKATAQILKLMKRSG